MKTLLISLWLLALSCAAVAQSSSCDLAGKDLPADRQKQFEQLLASGTADPAAVHFDRALAYAKIGNYRAALSDLELALKDSPWLDPASESGFKPISNCPAFKKMSNRIEAKYPPVASAKIAFTAGPRDLIPEGLAVDKADGSFYLSSIYHRKILKISPQGEVSDFVGEGQDGLLGVLGIKVDSRDRSVWAASERLGQSALFHFDSHGKLLAKYAPEESGRHLFNDLVVLSNGTVFVTDSEDGSVYELEPNTGKNPSKLIRFNLDGRLYPNGIALAASGKLVFVAHAFGIVALDPKTKSITELQAPAGISLSQIDGMYFWQGSIIAIQNGYGPNRIVRLRLRPDGKAVSAGKLLEFRSANLELPTTGAILNGSFYYIVNSQIDHEEDGKLKNEKELQSPKIAVLKLQSE